LDVEHLTREQPILDAILDAIAACLESTGAANHTGTVQALGHIL
jgi:hypothetical protein